MQLLNDSIFKRSESINLISNHLKMIFINDISNKLHIRYFKKWENNDKILSKNIKYFEIPYRNFEVTKGVGFDTGY